jgi:hypothetical protein
MKDFDMVIIRYILIISWLFSIASIIFLLKKKIKQHIKLSLVGLCAVLLVATTILGLGMIDGARLERGAVLFIHDFILELDNDKLPRMSSDLSEKDILQITALLNNLHRKNFKIEYYDTFGDLWDFLIHLEDGESYYCGLLAPNTFMTLFTEAEYELYRLEKFHEEN